MTDKFDMETIKNTKQTVVIFEDAGYVNLLPLVYWRGVFDLKCGICSLKERIERVMGIEKPLLYVRDYLAECIAEKDYGSCMTTMNPQSHQSVLFVNGRALLMDAIPDAPANQVGLAADGKQIAWVRADAALAAKIDAAAFLDAARLERLLDGVQRCRTPIRLMDWSWDLVNHNEAALEADWKTYGGPDHAGRICSGVHMLGQDHIAIGTRTVIKPCVTLDAENGPIMIDRDVTIRPNCTLEGPLYIGPGSLIQPGAVINEGVSIGPVCKVGGELEASIIHAYSNKQHDGFLGHSYIGQWVNLAADTINSDLKNTYGPVRVKVNGRDVDSGCMFVGLTMGDHSKTSVNTKFSTGCVIGFACSVFYSGFVTGFLPSFHWLTDQGRQRAIVEKTLDIAERVMARRKVTLTDAMSRLFVKIPALAGRYEYDSMQDDH